MTGQAFFVLTALAGGPRHGYGIVGEVAELSRGRVQLKIGSLYGVKHRAIFRLRQPAAPVVGLWPTTPERLGAVGYPHHDRAHRRLSALHNYSPGGLRLPRS